MQRFCKLYLNIICEHLLFSILRTKPVIIVEASLKHSNSINRTTLDCMENEQPATCMNLKLCFTYRGREVPGYIGKLLEK